MESWQLALLISQLFMLTAVRECRGLLIIMGLGWAVITGVVIAKEAIEHKEVVKQYQKYQSPVTRHKST
jgi:hypothetical protein